MRSDTLTKKFVHMGLIAAAGSSAINTADCADYEHHYEYKPRSSARSTSSSPSQTKFGILDSISSLIPETFHRPTTQFERTIAELREWHDLGDNWDGDGATPPIVSTLKQAEKFTGLLGDNISAPVPMLNATGRAGLFWNIPALYADLEFLPDNKIAYFIEKNGDKHKGTITFQEEKLPTVLASLLATA